MITRRSERFRRRALSLEKRFDAGEGASKRRAPARAERNDEELLRVNARQR